jgi:hypothetical protein
MSREEAISILILEGGNDYVNEPSKLKLDSDKFKLSKEKSEIKFTANNHLIITFFDKNVCDLFLSKSKDFILNKKIIELNKKKNNEIVIKGLNYTTIETYGIQLSQMGISRISQINKMN